MFFRWSVIWQEFSNSFLIPRPRRRGGMDKSLSLSLKICQCDDGWDELMLEDFFERLKVVPNPLGSEELGQFVLIPYDVAVIGLWKFEKQGCFIHLLSIVFILLVLLASYHRSEMSLLPVVVIFAPQFLRRFFLLLWLLWLHNKPWFSWLRIIYSGPYRIRFDHQLRDFGVPQVFGMHSHYPQTPPSCYNDLQLFGSVLSRIEDR